MYFITLVIFVNVADFLQLKHLLMKLSMTVISDEGKQTDRGVGVAENCI